MCCQVGEKRRMDYDTGKRHMRGSKPGYGGK